MDEIECLKVLIEADWIGGSFQDELVQGGDFFHFAGLDGIQEFAACQKVGVAANYTSRSNSKDSSSSIHC
jgi:hypothetical protein